MGSVNTEDVAPYSNWELHEVYINQPAIDQVRFASFVLAVISCIFNLLLIISLCGNISKTHLKFVASLTISNMILSVCHVVMKFRSFLSQWSGIKATPLPTNGIISSRNSLYLDDENDFLGFLKSNRPDDLLRNIFSMDSFSENRGYILKDDFSLIMNLTSAELMNNDKTVNYNSYLQFAKVCIPMKSLYFV
jgi:hypothetical protein